ncbi:MAG: AAA family ATPase [Proteobacteria bacterium]|nr:AAA family ATPase [Pseudomonadota bacterium]
MYETYFGLREKPFSILPDPKFLYFSNAHRMAFSMLEYGIVNQAGFTVITGTIGSGKTTLIRQLLGNVTGEIKVGLISHTSKFGGNLLEWILMAFDQPFEEGTYPRLYKRLRDFLEHEGERRGRAVLVIDEAQNLEAERLEELRMLSNINTDTMLLQLILVGQPELRSILQAPELTQFAQRVSSDFHLPALDRVEAKAYIEHRLQVAGGDPELFTSTAKRLIHDASDGVPRQINILADRCLVYAFAESTNVVTAKIVTKVLADKRRHGVFRMDEAGILA